jgi:diguanylate cyclase (GGDEF)-like protein
MNTPIDNTDRGLVRIRELEALLAAAQPEDVVIDTLNELAWELRTRDAARAESLCQDAQHRSTQGDFGTHAYTRGLIESLITLAFMDTYAGRSGSAATRCFEALSLIDPNTDLHATFKVWYTLGWNQLFLGDYPSALENSLKALKLARTLEHPLSVAWALDAVGSAYGVSDDFENAMPSHQQAVQTFLQSEEVLGQMTALNNLAYTLCRKGGSHAPALEASLHSLDLARPHGFNQEESVFSCTVAQILMDVGRFTDAEPYLRRASQGTTPGTNVVYSTALRELGRLHFMQNDLSTASTHLHAALEVAERHDQRVEASLCHQALSEVFERLGDTSRALHHHKRFHALHEATLGERVAQRLAVLSITHQVESARVEAEIHRLKNVELQREIEVRKRTQGILERLATLDPLTDLLNRRRFIELAHQEQQRATRYQHPMGLILIDIDHFKHINDTYGHPIGDEVLIGFAAFLHTVLREVDTPGRVGGEEFAVILPETNLQDARQVAERIRHGLTETPIQTTIGAIPITVSVGLTSLTGPEDQAVTFETLYKQADAALYAAKQAGRNQVRCCPET